MTQTLEKPMRTQQSIVGKVGRAVKLPFNIFAEEEDRVLQRLEEMQMNTPNTLPEKRFFKQ